MNVFVLVVFALLSTGTDAKFAARPYHTYDECMASLEQAVVQVVGDQDVVSAGGSCFAVKLERVVHADTVGGTQ
jgi:hypothetical protein